MCIRLDYALNLLICLRLIITVADSGWEDLIGENLMFLGSGFEPATHFYHRSW